MLSDILEMEDLLLKIVLKVAKVVMCENQTQTPQCLIDR